MKGGPRDSVDPILTIGLCLTTGMVAVVAPLEAAVAVAAALGLARAARRIGRAALCMGVLAVGAGFLRARGEVLGYEERLRAADDLTSGPARCVAEALVDSSPVEVRGVLRWQGRMWGAVCDPGPGGPGAAGPGARTWAGVASIYGGPADLARGDQIEVVATLAPPQRLWNTATGDPRPGEARLRAVRSGGAISTRVVRRASGTVASIDRQRARIRARIEATFPSALAAMARALVLGESDLSPDDDASFRASGLSHLLAVSGMHLVLVLAMFTSALAGALRRVEAVAARTDVGRLTALVAVPVTWLYAELAGAGGSTLRAAWMASAALAARALGRRTDGPRAFGVSMCAMAVADPLAAFDLSFMLSAAATGGLLMFARPFEVWFVARLGRLPAHVVPVPVLRATATTLAASVPCLPLLARTAPTVPLGGVAANLIAVPVGESVALPLCLLHAVLGAWPDAERGCAIVASGALVAVRAIARVFSFPLVTAEVPPPTSWQLVVLTVSVVAMAVGSIRPRRALLCAATSLLLLEMHARRTGQPRGVLRVTFLDVGQGDSAIVDLPDGRALVVDGGGLVGSPVDIGTRVLAPELRARRRTRVDAALTHPHPDHFGGFLTGLAGVRVGSLWDTGQGEIENLGGSYAALLEQLRARAVPVLRPAALCGEHVAGEARVLVLAPCPGPSSDRGPNDNSLVLAVTYRERTVLLAGDAEAEEERLLLGGARSALRADILKVGHHGSSTSSSPAFLAAVGPREAVVSVGRRNRFGHPRSETLAALHGAGARVWRTDEGGAIVALVDDAGHLTMSTARSGRGFWERLALP